MTAGRIRLARHGTPRWEGADPHVRAVGQALIAVMPLLFSGVLVWSVVHGPTAAFDFRHAYWSAGHRLLTGTGLYGWTQSQYRGGFAFVYPPLSAVLFAPPALLTRAAGATLITFIGLCVAPMTLAVLRVRDWRVYALAMAWLPICAGWLTANESLFMTFGTAAVWRWRESPGRAGFLTAAMISLKPLLWPLALWLLVTRRWRAAAHCLAWGLALNAMAWSVVGFDQVPRYLHAVAMDTRTAWRSGFGVAALIGHLGAGETVAMVVMLMVTAALVLGLIHSGLARRNDAGSLTLVVALTLVSSPLLWTHYFGLLLVPMAILRPRLNLLWFLPVAMWVNAPVAQPHIWQLAFFWLATAVILYVILRSAWTRPSRRGTRTAPSARRRW